MNEPNTTTHPVPRPPVTSPVVAVSLLAAVGFGALMLSHYSGVGAGGGQFAADASHHGGLALLLLLVVLEGVLAGWWGVLLLALRKGAAASRRAFVAGGLLHLLWLADRLYSAITPRGPAIPWHWRDWTVAGLLLVAWLVLLWDRHRKRMR